MADPLAPTPPDIPAVRAALAAQVQTYRDLIAAASKASGASRVRVDAALAAFEPGFFNTLLVALDARFPGRASDAGGPLDEVRRLAASLLHHGGRVADGAGDAVLRLDTGERIALNADDFETLAAAFLDAIESSQGSRP